MMATDLSTFFTGPLARFAGSIRLDDGASRLTGEDLLDLGTLRELIGRFAATMPGGEPRAIVSMWSQWHFSNVVVPSVVVRLLAGLSLPVSLDACSFALHDNGCTAGVLIPSHESLAPAAGAAGFTALTDFHLAPLIAFVASQFGVSAKLLWSNAAVSFAWTVQQCADHPGVDRESLAEAHDVLTAALTPAGGRNFLNGALKPSSLTPIEDCQRRICCLRYLLPGMADCGSFCPLPQQAGAGAQ
jgi:ferric iron reductase protein FhuF